MITGPKRFFNISTKLSTLIFFNFSSFFLFQFFFFSLFILILILLSYIHFQYYILSFFILYSFYFTFLFLIFSIFVFLFMLFIILCEYIFKLRTGNMEKNNKEKYQISFKFCWFKICPCFIYIDQLTLESNNISLHIKTLAFTILQLPGE